MEEPKSGEEGEIVATDISLLLGPMFGGKTSALIAAYKRALELGLVVFAVKPRMDNRYANSEIVSHDGQRIPAFAVESLADLDPSLYWDILLVDEAQFISGLASFCKRMLATTTNKKIIISGLNGDANAEPWQSVSELLAVCSMDIKFFKAECDLCGKEAAYTARFENGPKVEVGGGDKYFPACTFCFYKNLAKLKQGEQ